MMGLVTVSPAVSLKSILWRREECTIQYAGSRRHAHPGRDTFAPRFSQQGARRPLAAYPVMPAASDYLD